MATIYQDNVMSGYGINYDTIDYNEAYYDDHEEQFIEDQPDDYDYPF